MRSITAAVFSVLIALGSVSFAQPPAISGKPILDQFNTSPLNSLINGGSADYAWQQGITAGVAGLLTRFDLFVEIFEESYGPAAESEISITLGAPWQSRAPVWTTITKLKQGWNSFHLNNDGIVLAVGDEYSIGIHGQSTTHQFNPGFGISYDEHYPGGDLFVNASSAESVGNDLLFRTYVSPKRGVQHP